MLWTRSFWAICIANFLMFLGFYILLPILPMYLGEQLGASKLLTGVILASYTVCALIFRPFAGYIVDKFSRKPLMMLCNLIFISYFCGYIFAGTILLFTIIRATHGLTFAMITVSNNTMAIDLMPKSRQGEGIGYFGISANIAMASGPFISMNILEVFNNYDYIFITAFIAGLIGVLIMSFVKSPPRIMAERGRLSLNNFFLVKGIPAAVTMILMTISYGTITSYLAVYGRAEYQLTSEIGLSFLFMSIGLIVSRIFVGKLISRGFINQTVSSSCLLLTLGIIALISLKSVAFFYMSSLIIGASFGLMCPSFQAMFIALAHDNQRGTANATFFTSWDIGVGIGAVTGGFIAQYYNGFSMSFVSGIVFLLIGLMFFMLFSARYFNKHRVQ